jgi:hypothetical protein
MHRHQAGRISTTQANIQSSTVFPTFMNELLERA